jgi:hypothetical protein
MVETTDATTMRPLKEGETLEYLEGPGGTREPYIARSDLGRTLIALRNKSGRESGWLVATQDEIRDAIRTGGPDGNGIYGLKWVR